jgi:L-malate glycosyltransferase
MRILHTAATYAPSLDGVAEVVRNISERLVRRGHEVHVATGAVRSESSESVLSGVHVHRFPIRGNLAVGVHGETEGYRKFVNAGDWDLVVNHGLHVWPTDLLLEWVGSYSWPSLLVTHGLLDEHPAFREYYSAIPSRISSYAKWIRVSGCAGEASYAKRFGLPTPALITNGVDLDEWSRPRLDLRKLWGIGRRPWVVNVSNHSPLKNHHLFYELAESLRNLGAHFTLIAGTYPMAKWGLGRFGISGGCAYQCRTRSVLSRDVDLRVNLRREQVVSAVRDADIFVLTSRKEANSLAVLESMAAGIPWVSFEVGSAKENAGGIVAGSVQEMADAVRELARDPELRRRLGAEGRAQIVAKHDWDRIVEEYERVYVSTVSESGAVKSRVQDVA